MTACLATYRAAIGTWHLSSLSRKSKPPKSPTTPIKIKLLLSIILNSYGIFLCSLLILQCGDVHPNPGPDPTCENKAISLCHVNIQSLYLKSENYKRRKIDEIESILVNDHSMDIICLSETWLNDTIPDTSVDIKGYKIHRHDRVGHRACGAGMYVNLALPNRRAHELEYPDIDLLWVEIRVNLKKILVGACYRPPGQSAEEVTTFMSNLEDSIDLAFNAKPESIILMGDLNDSCTIWDSDHKKSELGLKLYDYINNHDLHQLIRNPTHILPYFPFTANILDLLITDSPGYITNFNQDHLPPIGSHHQIIYAELKIQYLRDKTYNREIWYYDRGDYQGLLTELEKVPWGDGNTQQNTIDDKATNWKNSFMDTCKSFIPNRTIKIRPTDKPWFTHDVKIAIRHRNRCYKRFKRTRRADHHADWKRSAMATNFIINLAKKNHQEKIKSLLLTTNPNEKTYWKLAKQIYGSKKILGIPSLMVENVPVTTSADKATNFNKYFAEQQSQPQIPFNHQLPPIIFLTETRLSSIQTTQTEVLKILKSLDIGKANGSDGVSNRLLKETAAQIATPLTELFNSSFSTSKVPSSWKESNICPIHKKDDKSQISNYRPIALLSNVGKVQERVVYLHLYRYLKEGNLLTWKNSGFKALDSAINQLLYITDKMHKALEEGRELCLVFLDVSKAFDKVWHSGLLHKLRCMGVEGHLFEWFCDYLSDRKIRVVINGQTSEWIPTTAGVPQGSILGPLLFLIFINDITSNIESDIHLFADDTSLMDIIEDHLLSYSKLNRDLKRLSTWSDKWLVTFNATKTVYLQVSRKLQPCPKPILKLHGQEIKEVHTHKHLGLTFNNTLTWTDHISSLVTKASRCIGLLKRLSRDVPRQCTEILYKSMIRPLLEYADIIFDGSADADLDRLENAQRQAALTCTAAYKHTSHNKLLEELGWPPLSRRRKNHRLSLMYKIQSNQAPLYLQNSCPPLTRNRTLYNLRSGMNITTPQQRTSTYQNSFFPQTIKDWNNLDILTRNATSIQSFKDSIKKATGYRVNKLYHHDSSKAAISQTRMRLGLSGLSAHRHHYKHIDNPKCPTCGAKTENPTHFFLLCPTFAAHRPTLITESCDIFQKYGVIIDFRERRFREYFILTLLNGSPSMTLRDNKSIFTLVQSFIHHSHRFP